MHKRTLAEWLVDIEARHPIEIDLGLDRVSLVWQRLESEVGNTVLASRKIFVVAGTNGKGSCIATMESVLLAHGYSVGTFTSPHFLCYNERIRINGEQVSDNSIVAAFEVIEAARESVRLTYFEFNTLAALVIFQRSSLDVVLLEVGLGGRLDAVNIIDADVAVLTSVDLDHQEWLGDTRSAIAREKLGIARPNHPLIIGEQDPPDGFGEMLVDTGANVVSLGNQFNFSLAPDRQKFDLELFFDGETKRLSDLPISALLPVNSSVGLQALCAAGFALDESLCQQALRDISLIGRCHVVNYKGNRVVLDVAHNPAAAKVLASFLKLSEENYTVAVASVLADKDWHSIVGNMNDVVDHWFVGEITNNPRAMDARSLMEVVYNASMNGESYSSIEAAFDEAVNGCNKGDTIVVFGSFSVVSAVLAVMEKEA